MDKNVIGVQLYTLRDFLKTPEDIVKSMKKVKEIGFENVQASGLGPIETKEFKKILDGEGLKCIHTHEAGKDIIENTEKIIEKLNILDCKHTAYPYPHKEFKTKSDWQALAAELNEAGKKFRKAGQCLSYHNHALELQRYGKTTALDIIYDETGSKNLYAEIDTYWIQYGGCVPVKWINKLKGRMPAIHLKDYGMIGNQVEMFEVGYGNLNMKKIVKAALNCGVEYFLIEQDRCQRDPFESLKMSFDFLAELNV